jgi:transcriptional regulator with XRE-family HTH domain
MTIDGTNPSRKRWSDLYAGLRSARMAIGLTQYELASMLDVDQTTISRWEAGTQIPDGGHTARLREILFRGRALSDARLKHFVQASIGLTVLLGRDGSILAQSDASRRVNVRAAITNFHDADVPQLETMWSAADSEGFFRGDLASIRFPLAWPAMTGEIVRVEATWHPMTLSDGVVCLLGDAQRIDPALYESLSAEGPRVTPLEAIL